MSEFTQRTVTTVEELEALPKARHYLLDRDGNIVSGYAWGWSVPEGRSDRRFTRGYTWLFVRDWGPFTVLSPAPSTVHVTDEQVEAMVRCATEFTCNERDAREVVGDLLSAAGLSVEGDGDE